MFSKAALLFIDRSVININISTDQTNYNIYNAAVSTGWNGLTPVDVTVTIESGVVVYATSTGNNAMRTGTGWPTGSTIKLINNGYICGKGGNGGHGGSSTGSGLTSGTAGGRAFLAEYAITITNNGTIAGGGGGGAGGGGGTTTSGGADNQETTTHGGGGGGGGRGGRSNSSGGGGGAGDDPGSSGGSGTFANNGAAGAGHNNGGAGGEWGASGNNDAGGGSSPGGGGQSVDGDTFITWLNTGTRFGAVSS